MRFLWLILLVPVWAVFMQRTVMYSTATHVKSFRELPLTRKTEVGTPEVLLDEMGKPGHLEWDSQQPACSGLRWWRATKRAC